MLGNHLNIVSELSKFDKFQESISETSDGSSFSLVINYPCSSTTFCDPIEAYAKPGVYLFEVWGAQGGKGCHSDGQTMDGAKGGHASAMFRIVSRTKIYLNIGGKGTDAEPGRMDKAVGGNNGGGDGGFDGSRIHGTAGGGGGGTDIRLESNKLSSRIIVAGGGGGSIYYGKGGAGGGEKGIDAVNYQNGVGGKGGDQEKGGSSSLDRGSTAGTEGIGGNGSNTNGTFSSDGGGGGGGGYFGGGGGSSKENHNNGFSAGGGGGSGYISNRCIKHQRAIVNENGEQEFLSPNGLSETGHAGSGAIKIVYFPDLLFIKTCEKSNKFCVIVFIYILLLLSK